MATGKSLTNLGRVVGMGMTVVIKTGEKAVLQSGPLTVCSVATLRIKNTQGQRLGVAMLHRGFEDQNKFRSDARKALHVLGDPAMLRVEVLAVQTAQDTAVESTSSDTEQDLNEDLQHLFKDVNRDDFTKNLTVAPSDGILSSTRQSQALVEHNGDVQMVESEPLLSQIKALLTGVTK